MQVGRDSENTVVADGVHPKQVLAQRDMLAG